MALANGTEVPDTGGTALGLLTDEHVYRRALGDR